MTWRMIGAVVHLVRGLPTLFLNYTSRSGFAKSWHELALVVGGIAGLLLEVVPEKGQWLPFWIAVVCLALGSLRGLSLKLEKIRGLDELVDLRSQLNEQEARDTRRRAEFKISIEKAVRRLCVELGVNTSACRASLYVHTGNSFSPYVRVSTNPQHEKVGRGIYPEEQGIIATAWQTGSAVVTDLPSSQAEYSDRLLKEFCIPKEISQGFNMASRSLIAARISDETAENLSHIGVLVIESTQARGVNKGTRAALLNHHKLASLREQLSVSRDFLPNPTDARERGF